MNKGMNMNVLFLKIIIVHRGGKEGMSEELFLFKR